MEIIGKIEEIRETIQRTQTFSVREFVIEVENVRNPQWNDHILFQTTNTNCALLDNFSLGQMVKVVFDIQGRRWKGNDGTERVFNTLSAWRIEPTDGNGMPIQQPYNATAQAQPAAAPAPAAPAPQNANVPEESDDLPF